MFKFDAQESARISIRVVDYLLLMAVTRGRSGSNLRTAIGDFIVRSEFLFYHDIAGLPLDNIFELARLTGMSCQQMEMVRAFIEAEPTPVTVGGVLAKNSLIQFTLATEARILADTRFISREDVENAKQKLNVAFTAAEEIAADEMAQMTYQSLIRLHAAVSFYLVETARPLPRMVRYRFYVSLPSLVVAYKLYDNAGRADELRSENKIVHPAFMQMNGRALSS